MADEGIVTQSVALNTREAAAAMAQSAPAEVKQESTPTSEAVIEPGKLSRRDAIDVGIQANKEPSNRPPRKREIVIAKDEPKQEVQKPRYEAPAEYNQEEREHFLSLTPEMQAKDLRLFKGHQDRRAKLNQDLQESGWVKDLAKDVNPFLQSVGEKLRPHEALTAALKLRHELETGDPVQNAINLLRRKGKEIPQALLDMAAGETPKESNPEFSELRKEVETLKLERQKESLKQEASQFLAAFETFQGQTNGANLSKFPDVNNSEAGVRLASELGSLVGGRTEISKQFIAKVRERLPSAGHVELFEQAYKFLGGRVDDSLAPVSKVAQQNHLQRSNRAAASVPGSGASFEPKGRLKMTRAEANAKAYRELQENR
jgi:hypothetical protein